MKDFSYLVTDIGDKTLTLAYRLVLEEYANGNIEDYEFEDEFYNTLQKIRSKKKFKDAVIISKAIDKYGEPNKIKHYNYKQDELDNMENKKGVVYVITNLVNEKIYVGKTSGTFNTRYRGAGVGISRVYGHIKQNLTGNTHLFTSILKYGFESFKVEIVFCSNSDYELAQKEVDLIKKYKSDNSDYGYNKTKGGDGVVISPRERFNKNNFLDGINPRKIEKLIENSDITYEEIMNLTDEEVVIVYKSGKDKDCFYLYSSINNLMKGRRVGARRGKTHGDYIAKGVVLCKILHNHGYNVPYYGTRIDVYLLKDLKIPENFKFYNKGGKFYEGEKPSLN